MSRTEIIVRPSTPNDHDAVKDVLAAAYSLLLADSYAPEVLRAVLPHICEPNPDLLGSETYFVATCEGSGLIGCGGWSRARPHSGELEAGVGHIRHFAVHPDQAGRGIGRLLFLACVKQAQAAGISEFESLATINAEGFYRSLGFETVAREDVLIAGMYPFPSVLMVRSITDG